MRYLIIPLLILGLGLTFAPTGALAAPPQGDLARLDRSAAVIEEIMSPQGNPDRSIPSDLIRDAYGIAVFPNVVKAAFGFGGRWGQGVIVARGSDGTWSAPSYLNMLGGSFGLQIGAEVTDLILVFMTPHSVQALGRGDLTLGGTASVAAGPIGRSGQISTDIKLAAEILSYSKTRGLFAGVALDGSVIQVDTRANYAMYGVRDPLFQRVAGIPPAARRYSCIVARYSGTPDRSYCS